MAKHLGRDALYTSGNVVVKLQEEERRPRTFTDIDFISYHGRENVYRVVEVSNMRAADIKRKLDLHERVLELLLNYFPEKFSYTLVATRYKLMGSPWESIIGRLSNYIVPARLEVIEVH